MATSGNLSLVSGFHGGGSSSPQKYPPPLLLPPGKREGRRERAHETAAPSFFLCGCPPRPDHAGHERAAASSFEMPLLQLQRRHSTRSRPVSCPHPCSLSRLFSSVAL
ncbi:hypothetical protein MRX96_026307 [Rhipicephalus microplus]